MKKVLNDYDVVEHEFSMAFAKYVREFNNLEYNIGLCISFLVNRSDPHATHPFLERLTMQAKLEVLKELVRDNRTNNEAFLKDFDEWFKLAARTKATRNQYIHGLWDIAPNLDKPIRFTPMKWVGRNIDDTEHMALDEYLETMGELNLVVEKFSQIRGKYGI